MPNPYFRFKQFTVFHNRCAMKVTTDACLFGAWCAAQLANRKNGKALDIGAGSGLLSLMAAQKTQLLMDAVEVDKAAAEQAAENIAASPWACRINTLQCDILQFAPQHHYDVVFSNPPFYEDEIVSADAARNLAHHGCGLRLHDLLHKIKELLAPEGEVFLLLPAKRQSRIFKMLADNGFQVMRQITVFPKPGNAAFRLMLHVSKKNKCDFLKEALVIQDETGSYTTQFRALLKDYYLHL